MGSRDFSRRIVGLSQNVFKSGDNRSAQFSLCGILLKKMFAEIYFSGRKITAQGRKDLDLIAGQVSGETEYIKMLFEILPISSLH